MSSLVGRACYFGVGSSQSVRLLESQDDFVQLKTTQIMTVLLRYNLCPTVSGTNLTSFPAPSQHLYPLSSSDPSSAPSPPSSPAIVRTSAISLYNVWKPFSLARNAAKRSGQTRRLWEGKQPCLTSPFTVFILVHSLIDILKHNPNAQMSYQVGFCLWLLTFEQEVAEQIQKCVCLAHHDPNPSSQRRNAGGMTSCLCSQTSRKMQRKRRSSV